MITSFVSRRQFIKIGLVTSGALTLAACQVRSGVDASAALVRASLDESGGLFDLVRFASLAASGHNTQPWKFRLTSNQVEILPDFSRELSVVDGTHRELWISLGCALENLCIAARSAGYDFAVQYPSSQAESIIVNLAPAQKQPDRLFTAIPLRQSVRTEYVEQKLDGALLQEIKSISVEPDTEMHFVENDQAIEKIIEFVNEGNRQQYSDQNFLSELIHWIRFNQKEALSSMDGLYSKCSGNPAVPRWLGEMVVNGTKPENQAETDAKKIRSAAGLVVIATSTDDLATWVRAGQVFQRLSLNLTRLGFSSSLFNQPVEVAELREPFGKEIGLASAKPQLLLRFGKADPMPYSLRRPVEEVVVA